MNLEPAGPFNLMTCGPVGAPTGAGGCPIHGVTPRPRREHDQTNRTRGAARPTREVPPRGLASGRGVLAGALWLQDRCCMTDPNLATYLNDHLAGAVAALELLEHLEKAHAGAPVARACRSCEPRSMPTAMRCSRS